MVFVRNDAKQPPLSPLYSGPYRVLERSLRFFKLQIGERTDTVSTLRLKAAYLPASAVPALPPRRGRPKAPSPPVPPHIPKVKKVAFSEAVHIITGRPTRLRKAPVRYQA
jgi:hypothetical protein